MHEVQKQSDRERYEVPEVHTDTDILSSEEVDVTQWLSKSVEPGGYRQLPYIHSTTRNR